MNDRNPDFLQRLTGALLRWADEQHRLAQDEKYWHAAQHDPRLMADIQCALSRAQADWPVAAGSRPARRWSISAAAAFGRHRASAADHASVAS